MIHSTVFALNDLLLLRYLLDFLCGRSRLFLLAFICVGILLTVPGALLQATGVLDGFETVLFFSPPYLLGIIVAAVCLTVQMARREIKRTGRFWPWYTSFCSAGSWMCSTRFFPSIPTDSST